MGRFDEWLEMLRREPQQRKKPDDEEHRLQVDCVKWFAIQYPAYYRQGALFAVPNGGRRDKLTGARLKAEGVQPGVADLVLLKPTARYHALFIEMKTAEGRQRDTQKHWQANVTADGYRYEVVRSLQQFVTVVKAYMAEYETYNKSKI